MLTGQMTMKLGLIKFQNCRIELSLVVGLYTYISYSLYILVGKKKVGAILDID